LGLIGIDALADTSAFIALEHARPLRAPMPEQLAVSCVTIGELIAGLLVAPTPSEQDRRLRTLLQANRLRPLRVDGQVAQAWAELRGVLRGSKRALDTNDSWIAATAIAHRLPLATQDDDYAHIPGLELILL
jgi:predicted nucleic acid-binding protein